MSRLDYTVRCQIGCINNTTGKLALPEAEVVCRKLAKAFGRAEIYNHDELVYIIEYQPRVEEKRRKKK